MERNNDIREIKICRRASAISYLLYADDILVAYRANSQNAKAIQEVLNVYSQWSSQLPNFDKSKILFSKNTPGSAQGFGKLMQTQDLSGLGFKKFKDINSALLDKLGWKLAKGKDCLWTRILSAKYLHNKSLFGSRFKVGDSYVWRSILNSKEVVKKGSCFKIGNGWLVNPWTGPWVPEEALAWRVADLLNPLYLSWDESKLHQNFDQKSIEAIKRVKIHGADREDKLFWIGTGTYIVQSDDMNNLNDMESLDAHTLLSDVHMDVEAYLDKGDTSISPILVLSMAIFPTCKTRSSNSALMRSAGKKANSGVKKCNNSVLLQSKNTR
ncbi:hypothetical protein FEM48_Zijuj09G0004100 [Ziziphus jujuba var. spinosa]|uniref:Reverse transcriptase domain-containing protein n=1 Tax=Ziziphus jujuba var. spinosa TaxID=714518 RepID=A0A978UPV0_ZIZJJ|nr:hypothetical protein FEM48_Zijuj09G0004100 [Ziziphus jujuba var. spinosa]